MARIDLSGFQILDLTRLLPGAFCTLLLSDFGARVIKVEEPGLGDPLRAAPPFVGTSSLPFAVLNRNKQSIALDLKSEGGRDVFRRLAERSDVLVESFRPGVMKRLGLVYETLAKANPGLVYCSITGYGQTPGPWRDRAGHDLNYLAVSGLLSLGDPARPTVPAIQLADLSGGMTAAMSILAALLSRVRTGQGATLDVSMTDGLFALMGYQMAEFLTLGMAAGDGFRRLHGTVPCYRLYRTKDGGHIAVAALEPKFWQGFCEAIGRADLAAEQWAPGLRSAEIAAELEKLFLAKTKAEWEKVFRRADACSEPVRMLSESVLDARLRDRGVFFSVPLSLSKGAGGPSVRGFRLAVQPTESPPEGTAPPGLGEHTDVILRSVGYSPAEADRLRHQGAVGA